MFVFVCFVFRLCCCVVVFVCVLFFLRNPRVRCFPKWQEKEAIARKQKAPFIFESLINASRALVASSGKTFTVGEKKEKREEEEPTARVKKSKSLLQMVSYFSSFPPSAG